MKPYQANFLNGTILLLMSVWSYFASINPSFTALIPAIFGLIFIVITPAIRKGNKVVAHIAVVLTLLLLVALFKPLSGVIDREEAMGIMRVGIMMLSAVIALIVFIISFVKARTKDRV